MRKIPFLSDNIRIKVNHIQYIIAPSKAKQKNLD